MRPHEHGRAPQRADVSRPVADERERLLRQRGEDEHALVALGERLARLGVDDLREEVVLVDVRARPLLHALAGDARSDDLREAVEVGRAHPEPGVDLGPHPLGPRLGSHHGEAHAEVVGREAALRERAREGQGVARRARDRVGAEVLDERQLALRHASGDGDDVQAEALAARMEPEAAGEEAVAVRVVQRHARHHAGHGERAGVDATEELEIGCRVGDDRRLSGRARRGVDARERFPRHCEHPQRIGVAKIVLTREGKAPQVLERAEVARLDAGEALAVERHALTDSRDQQSQPLELERGEPLARKGLEIGLEEHPASITQCDSHAVTLDRALVWTGDLNARALEPQPRVTVGLYDTTLRDGEQTVGVVLDPEQKVEIAKALSAAGIDRIEAGFPSGLRGRRPRDLPDPRGRASTPRSGASRARCGRTSRRSSSSACARR